jgi:hypothetical protein
MITGLSGATIWSQDLHNLLPFYRDELGLPVALESPEFVVLGIDTDAPSLGLGTHSEVKGRASDPYRHMVGLDSDNLDADFERLQASGVEFVERPRITTASGSPPSGTRRKLRPTLSANVRATSVVN